MWTTLHEVEYDGEQCPFGTIDLTPDVENDTDGTEHECNEPADHVGTRNHKCICGMEW